MALGQEELAKQLASFLSQAARDSTTTDKAWIGVASSVERITSMFETGWAAGLAKSVGIRQNIVQAGSAFASILRGDSKRVAEMLQAHVDAITKARTRIQEIDDYKGYYGKYASGMGLERAALLRQIREREAIQKLIASTSTLLQKEGFIYLPAILGSLAQARKYHEEINDSLLEAGSSWTERVSLMSRVTQLQIKTGISTKDMAESSKAIARYGFDLNGQWKEALDITSKMKVGLGVSADTSAQLLATTKAIGGSWKSVADGIARVKEDTALAADQAARFGIEVANAMALLGPKAGAQSGEIIEYINSLEGAAQQLGIQAGGMKDVLVGFTTEKGMMGATQLGLDPSFLKDLDQTKLATAKFADYVNKQLSGTTGYQRLVTLQLLAEQFGTTVEVIGRVNEIVAEQNKQRKTQLTLDQVYANQTKTLTAQWERLKVSLGAIANLVLVPMIATINAVLWPATKLLSIIGRSEVAMYALGTAMSLVLIAQTAKMITSLRSMAIGDILSGAGGRGGMLRGAGNVLARIFGLGGAGAGAGAAASGTVAATTAARATGWQMITRLLPQIGRTLLGIGAGVSLATVAIAASVGAVIVGGIYAYKKWRLNQWEKEQYRNQTEYVKAIVSGTGMSLGKWRSDTEAFFKANPQMSEEAMKRHLHNSALRLGIVQDALARGDETAAQKMIEGVAWNFGNMAKSAVFRQALSENITERRTSDMARDQAKIDGIDRLVTDNGLKNQILVDTAKRQLLEMEKSRVRQDERVDWSENKEACLRSVISNSSPAGTGLNYSAGVAHSSY